jgi:anaerobic magnesium-protoporphyrin IX monomethyl ester cyclase
MINSPFGGSGFRYWSPEVMIKEFDKIAELGITNVKIADEMFVLNPSHFMSLCDLLIERDYNFNIWCYARVDTVKEKYLETMKKAGINWVGLGIESGDANVRKGVVKGKFQDLNIVEIVDKIHDHDINIGANYIFGLPNDTKESMNTTLDLALSLNTDWANFYCAMAYPGSKLHEEISKKSPEVLPEYTGYPGWIGYSQHAYETYNLPTETLSAGEVLAFRDKAFIKYFTNPEYIKRMTNKYGKVFTQELDRMLSHTLKREFSK